MTRDGKPTSVRIRLLRLTGFALMMMLAIPLLLMVSAAWIHAAVVLHIPCQGDRASLEVAGFDSEAIEFTSRDGTVRHGWYSKGSEHPEIVVIVQPGHAGNTSFALADAAIFARGGYSTLIFEHRSCANPRNLSGTGILEVADVLGAVDYLDSRSDVKHIAAMGFSAGGTSIVTAAGQDERIEMVISEGGYTSLADDVLDTDIPNQHPIERIYRRFLLWSFALQLGPNKLHPAPIDVIANVSPRPILLIYGDQEARVGNILYEAAHDPKEIWIIVGVRHGGYEQIAGEEYHQRLGTFIDHAFGVQRDKVQ